MKVNSIAEKGTNIINEDNFIIKDNMFGVFDGATSLDKYIDSKGKTGGYLASSIAKEAFGYNDIPLVDLANIANDKIMQEMKRRKITVENKVNLWSTSAAIVRIVNSKLDWLQIGDSLILIINKDNSFRLLVENYDHDEAVLVMWKQLADKGVRNIWNEISDASVKLRKTMNVNYGILNGEKEMNNFLNIGVENLNNIAHILLFTDGLFIPKKDPKKPDDFSKFVELFLSGGLAEVKKYVRNIEKSDPECSIYPRFKQYDDIVAISISL